MVHPLERIAVIAASPVALGAEPPDWVNVPLEVPAVLMHTRMPSIDAWLRLVPKNVFVKLVCGIGIDGSNFMVVRLEQCTKACVQELPLKVRPVILTVSNLLA